MPMILHYHPDAVSDDAPGDAVVSTGHFLCKKCGREFDLLDDRFHRYYEGKSGQVFGFFDGEYITHDIDEWEEPSAWRDVIRCDEVIT